jgi:bifunctional NMN adenylyltransferase/nudix hydrolase
MKRTGVIIARFQVAHVDQGLKNFIDGIKSENQETGIILGVTKIPGSKRNPFEFELRKQMLLQEYPSIGIFPLFDDPSDWTWSKNLEKIIHENLPSREYIVYGSQNGFIDRYKGTLPVRSTGSIHVTSGESLRSLLEMNKNSQSFREGILYGLQQTYAKIYPTVDIALFRFQRSEILLGMKSIDKKWRLPGGFADPTDVSYEVAARRELEEECGVKDVAGLRYEGSFRVDDWRYNDEEDKIMTCLFSADHVAGEVTGSDDIEQVKWFKTGDVSKLLLENSVAPEHRPLLMFLLEKYGK